MQVLVCLALIGSIWLAADAGAAEGWLTALGKDTVVCASPKAEAGVRQAAERVLAELRKTNPDAALHDPDQLATEYEVLGTHHVIVVGGWADNLLLRATWGHWASSRDQREWQARGEDLAREYMGLWDRDMPPLQWRWQHELFAFGYGDFDGAGVGYVQTVRNPYTILLRTVPGQKSEVIRPKDEFPRNQMYFIVHLTGTGPQGIAKATDAFLAGGLLNGVIAGNEEDLPADWTLERLGRRQLLTDLPSWAPISNLPHGVQYLGQQMPGSHLYAGFVEASGVRPTRCWRLKYRVPSGFVLYDSYPTNRASGNELFIAQMASAADAQKAAAAIGNKTDAVAQSLKGKVGVRGEYVVMHSFWMAEGTELLRQAVAQ